jgi:hypothetical protein
MSQLATLFFLHAFAAEMPVILGLELCLILADVLPRVGHIRASSLAACAAHAVLAREGVERLEIVANSLEACCCIRSKFYVFALPAHTFFDPFVAILFNSRNAKL